MMQSRKSSTLFELLIALALLAGLAALIMPAMLDSLDERAFEAAADLTDDQLLLARAHSQSTGAPVEVVYKPNPPRVVARLLPDQDAADEDASSGLHAPESPLSSSIKVRLDGDAAHAGDIAEAWANQRLEHGVSISTRPPQSQGSSKSSAAGAGTSSTPVINSQTAFIDSAAVDELDDAPVEDDIRLAVFMPDGSALMSHAVWLSDEGGRLCRLVINPWTGMPAFLRMDGSAALDDDAAEMSTREDADDSAPDVDDSVTGAGRRNDPTADSRAARDRFGGSAQP